MRFKQFSEAWTPRIPPPKLDPTRKGFHWLDKATHNLATNIALAGLAQEPFDPDISNPVDVRYAEMYGLGPTFNISPEELEDRFRKAKESVSKEKYAKAFVADMEKFLGRDRQDFLNGDSNAMPSTADQWKKWLDHILSERIQKVLRDELITNKEFLQQFNELYWGKVKQTYSGQLSDKFADVLLNSQIMKSLDKRVEQDPNIKNILYKIGEVVYDDIFVLIPKLIKEPGNIAGISGRRQAFSANPTPAPRGNNTNNTDETDKEQDWLSPNPPTSNTGNATSNAAINTNQTITLGGERWIKKANGWVDASGKPARADIAKSLDSILAQAENPQQPKPNTGPRRRAPAPNNSPNVNMTYQGQRVNPPTASSFKPPSSGLSESLINTISLLTTKQKARLLNEVKRSLRKQK
jgi:hypothetical protein